MVVGQRRRQTVASAAVAAVVKTSTDVAVIVSALSPTGPLVPTRRAAVLNASSRLAMAKVLPIATLVLTSKARLGPLRPPKAKRQPAAWPTPTAVRRSSRPAVAMAAVAVAGASPLVRLVACGLRRSLVATVVGPVEAAAGQVATAARPAVAAAV